MRTILPLLGALLLLSGFRTVSPEQIAQRVIEETEQQFDVSEHAELYQYVRATENGEVFEGKMFIIFRYEPDMVRGVFRLLPDDDSLGVTLISNQEPGKLPELAHYDRNTGAGGLVATQKMGTKLGDTDWFFEGIFDDDKNPWTFRKVGESVVRGSRVDIIEGYYNDPVLRENATYDKRRILIRQEDRLPMASEFYDAQGNLSYVVDLLHREQFILRGEPHIRTKQLQLIDFENGSTTILTRIASNWEPDLPDYIYELGFAESWDSDTDTMIRDGLEPMNN